MISVFPKGLRRRNLHTVDIKKPTDTDTVEALNDRLFIAPVVSDLHKTQFEHQQGIYARTTTIAQRAYSAIGQEAICRGVVVEAVKTTAKQRCQVNRVFKLFERISAKLVDFLTNSLIIATEKVDCLDLF